MSLMRRAGVMTLWVVLLGLRPAIGVSSEIVPDSVVQTAVHKYVNDVSSQGEAQGQQGVWLQSGEAVLAQYQGTLPLPVASLTKIVTTLAALHAWELMHHFGTIVSTTGPVRNGVLQGDLVIRGGGDPFFVSEDATEVRRALRQLGITRVTGKLVIVGDFYMNFTTNPLLAGKLLKHALQDGGGGTPPRRNKRGKVQTTRRPTPSEPSIAIAGAIQTVDVFDGKQTPLIRRRSLPLVQILKRMNVYSNNAMAEILTKELGGLEMMRQHAAQAAGVPARALQLINGSGLGQQTSLPPALCVPY